MNAKLLILLFSTVSAIAQYSDVRVVSGIPVNLAPIHAWAATNGSPESRPLKQWKEIQVVDIVEKGVNSARCIVRIDGGPTTNEVFVDNLPPGAYQQIDQLKQLRAKRDDLRAYVAGEDKRIARAGADMPLVSSDDYPSVQAALNRDTQRLNEAKDRLAELDNGIRQLVEHPPTDFAIFTLQRNLGLQIWDCGLRP